MEAWRNSRRAAGNLETERLKAGLESFQAISEDILTQNRFKSVMILLRQIEAMILIFIYGAKRTERQTALMMLFTQGLSYQIGLLLSSLS